MTAVPCPFCGSEHTAGTPVCPTTNRRLQGLLPVATIIDDKYRIDGIIGVGGMGVVYQAKHSKIARDVALKMLLPEYIVYPELVARVEREARTAGQIDHANVVSIVDLGSTPDYGPYIAMELLRGQELATMVEKAGGRLDPGEAVDVMRQVLAGLEAAHKKGVIHRDLKPENIFLTETDEGVKGVKVLDFGISKLRDEGALTSLTRTGTVMGTPQFMAPEQAAGARDQDARIDIYAAGAVLYAVLCNGLPYEAENYNLLINEILNKPPIQILNRAPGLDPRLAAIVMRSISKKPEQRYQTARAMAEALAAWYEIRHTPRTGSIKLSAMRMAAGVLDAGAIELRRPARQMSAAPALLAPSPVVQYDELSPDDPAYIDRGEATIVVPVPYHGQSDAGYDDPSATAPLSESFGALAEPRPSSPAPSSVPPEARPSSPSLNPSSPSMNPSSPSQIPSILLESPLDAPPLVLPAQPKLPPSDAAWARLRTGARSTAAAADDDDDVALNLRDHPRRSSLPVMLFLLALTLGGGVLALRFLATPTWRRLVGVGGSPFDATAPGPRVSSPEPVHPSAHPMPVAPMTPRPATAPPTSDASAAPRGPGLPGTPGEPAVPPPPGQTAPGAPDGTHHHHNHHPAP